MSNGRQLFYFLFLFCHSSFPKPNILLRHFATVIARTYLKFDIKELREPEGYIYKNLHFYCLSGPRNQSRLFNRPMLRRLSERSQISAGSPGIRSYFTTESRPRVEPWLMNINTNYNDTHDPSRNRKKRRFWMKGENNRNNVGLLNKKWL